LKVVSIVGMAGSGKSEVARVFENSGFVKIRFGDITDDEVRKRGLDLNEKNERLVREELRQDHGMAAYAKLSIPRIDAALKSSNVVLDGLYSWEEYILLKSRYGESLVLVAVWASPTKRHERLGKRPVRPLTREEAAARDIAEIEKSNKGGPIAMADYIILNDSSLEALTEATRRLLTALN
jgi:dephospho-CoA kinase